MSIENIKQEQEWNIDDYFFSEQEWLNEFD